MSQHRNEPGLHVPSPTPTPAMIRWLAAAGLWLLARLRPDHSSLYGGWYQQNLGGQQHLYISISCAPGRRLKRPRRVDALEALGFLNKLIPDGFSSPATTSHDQVPPSGDQARAPRADGAFVEQSGRKRGRIGARLARRETASLPPVAEFPSVANEGVELLASQRDRVPRARSPARPRTEAYTTAQGLRAQLTVAPRFERIKTT
jgi:hypothetical protein